MKKEYRYLIDAMDENKRKNLRLQSRLEQTGANNKAKLFAVINGIVMPIL